MPYSDIYLYSPLTLKTVKEGQYRAMLLQCILSELFHLIDGLKQEDPFAFVFSSPACFFPDDWSHELGCLHKMAEHAKQLPYSFASLSAEIEAFQEVLETTIARIFAAHKREEAIALSDLWLDLKLLYAHLEPFLQACNENEPLLFFLCKHAEAIHQLTSVKTRRNPSIDPFAPPFAPYVS